MPATLHRATFLTLHLNGLGNNWHPDWLRDSLAYRIGPMKSTVALGRYNVSQVYWSVLKEAGPAGPVFSVNMGTGYTGPINFQRVASPRRISHLDMTLEVDAGVVRLFINGHIVAEHINANLVEAFKLMLPLSHYEALKQAKVLRRALPPESCELQYLHLFEHIKGAAAWNCTNDEALHSFLRSMTREHKLAREQYIGWQALIALTVFMPEQVSLAIGIPLRDNGTDLLCRAVDIRDTTVRWTGLQVCELQERHLPNGGSNEERVLTFTRNAKLNHYAPTDDWLVIWLRPEQTFEVDASSLRDLFEAEPKLPFKRILILLDTLTTEDGVLVVTSVYCRNPAENFQFNVDLSTLDSKGRIGPELEQTSENKRIVTNRHLRAEWCLKLF